MDGDGGKILVQTRIEAELAEKIDAFAERLNMSRAVFLSALLETAMEQNEWLIKLVASRYMKPVRDLLKSWGTGAKKGREPRAAKA